MKKRFLFLFPIIASLLAGCNFKDINSAVISWTNHHILDPIGSKIPGYVDSDKANIELEFEEGKDLTQSSKKGELGSFDLLAPAAGVIVNEQPTFSWTESKNAVSYTLEVCSSKSFDNNSNSIVYTKESNIDATSFKLSATLKTKNINYYWRVTAVNEFNSKAVGREKVSEVRTFFYHIESTGEVEIPVGEAGDWALHKVGSVADIAIDHNDFFGTGDQDSLKITFEKEKTSQGPGYEKSDGWIVVQKTVEQDFFGPDAFYCNFYYMGHDSTILIRVIDQDGELWYKQVKFTQDSRQIAILKFDEFTLRTGDTVVQNETFNYEHIQAIEVCFEKTFGDGCCIVGGMKAVTFDTYKDLFIKNFNYKLIEEDLWMYESYNFARTISDDGSELTLEYTSQAGFNGNEKGMGSYGYGFIKIPLERYFGDGNAVKVKIKYTGYKSNVNAIIRIYEPDKDRWSYEQPFSTLVEDEYKEITIPFMAFGQSSIVEGKRQFYYISQIQLGLNNCYGSGTLSYKDFEIVELPSVSKNPRVVGSDGIIENFDQYAYRGQAYEQWETSVDNKDEGIFLLSDEKFNDGTNVNAGKFTYKSDMSMASYDIYTDVQVNDLNAVKFWIKDASVANTTDARFQNYTGEDVSPLVVIQVALKDGRWYRYQIDKAPRIWTEYVIPFSEFKIYQGREYDTSDPVISQNVVNFAFGMQYFYMYLGKAVPLYTQNNPVYMDNISFSSASEIKINKLENELKPDENGAILVDNFEYQNENELKLHWFGLNKFEHEKLALSDEVSSEGNSHSMKLDYKNVDSPAYATYPTFDAQAQATAISLDIKGGEGVTIYLNFYIRAGSSLLQYRYTFSNVSTSWNRYVIGFGTNNFTPISSTTAALGKTSIRDLQRITFGATGGNGNVSSFYVDNVKFLLNDDNGQELDYNVKEITPLQ